MPDTSAPVGLITAAMAATGSQPTTSSGQPPSRGYRKRKNHRAGKKKRRKSFSMNNGDSGRGSGGGGRGGNDGDGDNVEDDPLKEASRDDFYMTERHRSSLSIDSTDLLDHREQTPFLRARRPSLAVASHQGGKLLFAQASPTTRLRPVLTITDDDEDRGATSDEGAPLLAQSMRRADAALAPSSSFGYGAVETRESSSRHGRGSRPQSRRGGNGNGSSPSGSARKPAFLNPSFGGAASYNVNYPPSVPGSPPLRPMDRPNHISISFGDEMLREEMSAEQKDDEQNRLGTSGSQPRSPSRVHRGTTLLGSLHSTNLLERVATGEGEAATGAEADVCFPQDGLSGEEDEHEDSRDWSPHRVRANRRRRGKWPDLSILEDWSRFEVGHSQARRAKTIKEPQLVNGRLRPIHKGWHRAEEDAPYRFTYFNEEFQSTIHSQTISELVQPGSSFRELFLPDPVVLSDEEEEEEEVQGSLQSVPSLLSPDVSSDKLGEGGDRDKTGEKLGTTPQTRSATPVPTPVVPEPAAEPRQGERPVWWLDVLSPTEAEMRVLSKTFAIHPLTAEDIVMQEAREKVELFQHYYFVNYRSFDQDPNSETFLEPINMYVVVFREGVLSFHFSMTPHPANVRRRIRQLRDYMLLSPDWVSYAIIDDITDVFVPLIQNIEDEVDEIDDAILQIHSGVAAADRGLREKVDCEKEDSPAHRALADSDMLRRVGACRKRVMSLYRLLGNKADVIRGFAKRCNEHWEVAPRSEIGLYLGDIQDHIVTMTSNLSHYEKILSRSHGNYLAQINIRMNERQEQTADVLGKLTVLGTIVLPMNIITGLWGMNVWVPGQDYEGDLRWFAAITAGLLFFGLACYLIAKRVYKIV